MTLSQQQVRELRRSDVGRTGNRVAKAIELSGESRAAIARSTGLHYTYVTDVASGRFQTVTVEKAHVFARHFGCEIADLFPASREAVAS